MENKIIMTQWYESPCGTLILGSYDDKLCLCDWEVENHRSRIDARLKRKLVSEMQEGSSEIISRAAAQLDEYFAGRRFMFDIPLLFVGSDFQKTVWHELLNIPYGRTISYGEMASTIGSPKSVRAVANANGANAISIFVPCHRVIGNNGSLIGYAGGMDAKRYLLELEGVSVK